ncbi:tRNA wybutosine-synthesizing protein 5-like [Ptychodera flava]|uniref:tRNA wybutosine-synthesizing protein 5-like n=1 Tax=Ptychodera flava TaxID=63121 RepID=UPI00396A8987
MAFSASVTWWTLFLTYIAATSSEDHDPTSWPGHMEPLGSRKQWQPVATLESYPKSEEFFASYVLPSVPVLFKGVAKEYPAFKLWTDDFLLGLPETATTRVTIEMAKKEDRNKPGYDATFENFLKTYNESDIYMVATAPDFLRKFIPLPDALKCDEVIEELVDTVVWFSSGGTKSVLHNDDVDNINCLYRGRKELLFIDFLKYRKTVVLDNYDRGFSGVDVDKVDFTKYPELNNVEYHFANMTPGDCLFIPFKWFHQVNSFDGNIAVNIWWNHNPKLIPTQDNCGNPQPESIADVVFEVDRVKESELYADENSLVSKLLGGCVAERSITFEEFEKWLQKDSDLLTLIEYWTDECSQLARELFGLLDMDKDAMLSKEDLHIVSERENEIEMKGEESELILIAEEFGAIMEEQQAEMTELAQKNLRRSQKDAKDEL